MRYVKAPKQINYKNLLDKNSLSPSSYQKFKIKNKNKFMLKIFIDEMKSGKEVGSKEYIKKSNRFFIRTKALQEEYLFLDLNRVSIIPIKPLSFKDMELEEGEILITKDSNVGEVVYLEKDYLDCMVCAGIKSLLINKDKKWYVLAFLKNYFFKKQLELLISRGATLKHAKKKFLECYIPFPKKKDVIDKVSSLMESWIKKEKELKKQFKEINFMFEKELKNNQNSKLFNFNPPTYKEINNSRRLDVGTYSEEYKEIIYLIKNYSYGYFNIPKDKFKSGGTPRKRIIGKGNKIWVTPSDISNYGYILNYEKILCEKSNITKNCLIVGNRTSKEKLGEYVGISFFYDFNLFDIGHHNQGCYRVEDLKKDDLKSVALIFNTRLYRILCGKMSLGSKMKEMKINHFSQLPIPNLQSKIKKSLLSKYSKILELSLEVKDIKEEINDYVYKITKGEL